MKQLMLAAAVQLANRSLGITSEDQYWDKTMARIVTENGVTRDVRAAINSSANVSIGAGRFGGQCPHFTSGSQCVKVAGNPFALHSDFTIEGHWYFDDIDANINQYMMDFGNNGFILRYYSTGLMVYNSGSNPIQTTFKPQNNRWYHIALVRYNQTLTLYVDGVAIGSALFTLSIAHSDYTLGNYAGTGYHVRGKVDQFRIVQEAIYTADFTPPTEPFPIGSAEGGYDPYWANVVALIDDASGGEFVDTKGLHTVNKVGAVTVSNIDKKIGRVSAGLTAAGQYLSILDSNNSFDFAGGDFTIECWVKPTAANGNTPALLARGSTSIFGSWMLTLSALRPQFRWTTNGTSWNRNNVLTAGSTMATGVWSHLAIVRSSTSLMVFINGDMVSTFAIGTDVLTSSDVPLTVGAGSDGGIGFIGVIDSLRITKGVGRYISGFTPRMKESYANNNSIVKSANDPYWGRVLALLDYSKDIGAGPDEFSIVLKRAGGVINSEFELFGSPTLKLGTGAGSGFNYGNGTKPLLGSMDSTVELWVNTTHALGENLPFIGQNHASAAGSWFLGEAFGKARFYIRGGLELNSAATVSDGQWHHVALTIRSGIAYLYVDGVMQAQGSVVAQAPSYNGNIQVGYNIAADVSAGYRLNLSRVKVTQGVSRYAANFTPDINTVQLFGLAV